MRGHNGEGWSASPAVDAFPSSEPHLLTLCSRLQDAHARLSRLNELATTTLGRIYGALPPQAGGKVSGPSGEGMLPMINAVIDGLHGQIDEIENAMQRLAAL